VDGSVGSASRSRMTTCSKYGATARAAVSPPMPAPMMTARFPMVLGMAQCLPTVSASLRSMLRARERVDPIPDFPSHTRETNEHRRHAVALGECDDFAVHSAALVHAHENSHVNLT